MHLKGVRPKIMIDFDRANSVGLGYIKSWVPGGNISGNEYFPINPTRSDKKPGSFAINLSTGKWMEGATFESGGDPVSLYAYLFRSELKGSTEGEIQLEAAKEILRKYDGQTISDTKFKKQTGAWTGYRQLQQGLDNPPEIDYSWHAENSAKKPFERDWNFYSKSGKLVLKIARFRDNEGKSDKPFTLWTNGEVTKWRSINLECKNPVYNLLGLLEKQSAPVLLTEGQKNAEDSREILKDHFATTCVYRSPDKTDLEPLRGRKVYLWADPDNAGRKKASALKSILINMECRVHIVHSPDNKEKWDISDAINEGWTVNQLVDHIKSYKEEGVTIKEEVYLDDMNLPFKIVGIAPGFIFIYSERFRLVEKFKTSSLGKGSLMSLMSLEKWQEFFPGDKGPVWDSAINYVLTEAEKAPLWDTSLVRGAGAWRDKGGKLVISTGEHIIIDGKNRDLMSSDSKYVYQRSTYRPYTTESPIDVEESSRFFEIFMTLSFKSELQSILLAGWTFLAPFCGVLKWRPHVWLTGDSGSGKSTVMAIIDDMMEGFSEYVVANGSSEAGIRQRLNNCATPVKIDEMESNDKYSKETIQLLITTARQSSTGGLNTPEILKGSSDGLGSSFKINSMFFFASILAAVENGADMDRIEILELKAPEEINREERKKQYSKLLGLVDDIITPDFKSRFYSRGLNILEETLKAVDIFVALSADILKNQRGGDQKGTLLAGAYMISHDEAPTKEEALEWASQFDLVTAREENFNKPDAEKCMDVIMGFQVDLITPDGRRKQTVAMWIEDYFDKIGEHRECSHIPRHLAGHGIRINDDKTIDIAASYDSLKRVLRETPWESTYGRLLRRHKDVVPGAPKTARFNGSGKGIIRIKYDDCPF